MLDGPAVAVNHGKRVLAIVDNELDGARQLMATQLVAPDGRHAGDVRLGASEQTKVRRAEADALGVRDHDALFRRSTFVIGIR